LGFWEQYETEPSNIRISQLRIAVECFRSDFLVHVDSEGTGLVSEKDAVVLDVVGILLEDLAG